MGLKDGGIILIVSIVVVAGVVGYISKRYLGKDDAPIEEFCESIMEDQLGLPEGFIDLSPYSPENAEKQD
jgi:hypothetical protein